MEIAFMFAYCYAFFALHRCIPSFAGTQVHPFFLLEELIKTGTKWYNNLRFSYVFDVSFYIPLIYVFL
jgi:hypothetical protein